MFERRFLIVSLLFVWALPRDSFSASELTMYTYESLLSKGGFVRMHLPLFEKRCGCKIKTISVGDAGQMIARVELDRKLGKNTADLVMGVDQSQWERIRKYSEPWGDWKPVGLSRVPGKLQIQEGFLPFDYGLFAWIADLEAVKKSGISKITRLEDLLQPRLKRNLILQDPRTSSPGLAWLLYTRMILKDHFKEFWMGFRTQWLTLAPSWDSSYALFMKKQAPLIWSYLTSQAYHDHPNYQAVLLKEGLPMQIEGVVVLKGAFRDPAKKQIIRSYLDFLLEGEIQEMIPKTQWMMPVVDGCKLPESFKKLPQPEKTFLLPGGSDEIQQALKEWGEIVEGSSS